MIQLLQDTFLYVLNTLIHNAPSLILGILVASAIATYVNPEKLKAVLLKKSSVSISGSVAFGAFTPFCACGTMAVVVSMLTTALPWGPIMAFLTSSPLMSPDHFIMISGIISLKFAIALTAASIIIGYASGYITHFIEKNTNFLTGQARFAQKQKSSCCCSAPPKADCCSKGVENTIKEQTAAAVQSCCSKPTVPSCCSAPAVSSCCQTSVPIVQEISFIEKYKLKELADTFVDIGLKKVLLFFSIFAAVGYFINRFVPAEIIVKLFSSGNIFAVPLSALIGLPLYVSGASSIPIVKTLMDAGASGGAMLAFMITGPGTSAGAIAGIATIMKKRALSLYIGYILAGGIILGYLYDALIMLGL